MRKTQKYTVHCVDKSEFGHFNSFKGDVCQNILDLSDPIVFFFFSLSENIEQSISSQDYYPLFVGVVDYAVFKI